MSIRALAWAFDQEVQPSSTKFVLVALANFASETGKTYPSVSTICRITSQHYDTVSKGILSLIHLGLLKDTGQTRGVTGQVKVYQMPDEACDLKTPENRGGKVPVKVRERLGQDPGKPGTEPVTCNREPSPDGEAKKKRWAEDAPIPLLLNTPEFIKAWSAWIADRKQRRKAITLQAAELQFQKFIDWGVEEAIKAINNSIENGYQGVFKVDDRRFNQPTKNGKQHATAF